MFMRILLVVLLCGVAMQAARAADALPTAADPVFERRVRAITEELRCLVCQNQTVADSTAPLAIDLANQVRSQLRDGRTPEQIRTYMTDRYGDFVLYKPPLRTSTVLLWLGPVALLLLGLAVLWRTLAQRRVAPAARGLSEEERRRAAALLKEE